MAEEVKKQADTRTATQRLTDAENDIGQAFATLDYITKDLGLIKSALKLLDNKLNAFIKATVDGQTITDDVIDNLMVQNNISDLAARVTNMVAQGMLSSEEMVSDHSFIVGQESDANGTVTNPRVQFAIRTLEQETQTKLVGTKVGDSVSFQEGKLVFKVLESYKINAMPTPPQPEAPPTPTAPETPHNDPVVQADSGVPKQA